LLLSTVIFLLCRWALASNIARKAGFPEMADEAAAPGRLLLMFPS
jgi:hypothetical protein